MNRTVTWLRRRTAPGAQHLGEVAAASGAQLALPHPAAQGPDRPQGASPDHRFGGRSSGSRCAPGPADHAPLPDGADAPLDGFPDPAADNAYWHEDLVIDAPAQGRHEGPGDPRHARGRLGLTHAPPQELQHSHRAACNVPAPNPNAVQGPRPAPAEVHSIFSTSSFTPMARFGTPMFNPTPDTRSA